MHDKKPISSYKVILWPLHHCTKIWYHNYCIAIYVEGKGVYDKENLGLNINKICISKIWSNLFMYRFWREIDLRIYRMFQKIANKTHFSLYYIIKILFLGFLSCWIYLKTMKFLNWEIYSKRLGIFNVFTELSKFYFVSSKDNIEIHIILNSRIKLLI